MCVCVCVLALEKGVGSGLRHADCEAVLDVEKGCVTPLAIIFDKAKVVEILIDQELENAQYINVHPGTNRATVGIKPSDLKKFAEEHGNVLKYMRLAPLFAEGTLHAKIDTVLLMCMCVCVCAHACS